MSAQEFSKQINEIYQKYELEKKADRSLLPQIENYLHHISEDLNSTDFRFVMELIQNGVDSHKVSPDGRPVPVRIRFCLEQDRLIVANDGQPFSIEDVDRICGMPKQYKGLKKIGYKGIGFKSVAAITHNPQIYSPGCYFEFDKTKHPYEYVWLVIPHWISPESAPAVATQYRDWVTFVLPLRHDRKTELAERFDKYADISSGALLLFLDNLAELVIENKPADRYMRLRKEVNGHGLTVIKRQQNGAMEEELGQWVVVSHLLNNPPPAACQNYIDHRHLKAPDQNSPIDLGETKISVAFRISEGKFVKKEKGVYAFFKVNSEESGLQFTVQADFLTTLNRENLLSNSPWNDWLMENLPTAIEKAITELKKHPQLYQVIYQALPLIYEGKDKFKPMVERLIKRLQNQPIILTNQTGENQWIEPVVAVWVEPNLRALLEDEDLAYLYPQKRALVSSLVSSDERLKDKRIEQFLLETLKIQKIDDKEFLNCLQKRDWLKTKPTTWFVRLFQYLMTLRERKFLKQLPIIPTTAGLTNANDDKLFLPTTTNLNVSGAKLVDLKLVQSLDVTDFLQKELGLQPATPTGLIEQVIIPALKQPVYSLTPAIRQEYLEFVAAHYHDLPPKLGQQLAQHLLLEAQDGTWQPLKQLCLAENSLADYLLAQDKPSKYLVMASPLVKFYQQLGLPTAPSIEILAQVLSDWTWLADKDLTWFQVLYTYLADLEIHAIGAPMPLYTQTGQLLSANEQVYFWPDTFDPDLLSEEKINFVSPDLFNTPTKSTGFAISSAKIRSFLELVGITEFEPLNIINNTVIAEFKKATKTGQYADKLLDYTVFSLKTLQNMADATTLETVKQVIRLKTTAGEWHLPHDIYLTDKYGAMDFETLLAGLPVHFISLDYLEKLSNQQAWVEFLSELGVKNQLELIRLSPKERLDKLAPHLVPYGQAIIDTQLEGKEVADLRKLNHHRLLEHISLAWLAEIIGSAEPSRLELLLTLLAEIWQPDLAEVRYERWWQQKPLPPQTRPSHVAWLLRNNAILPTHHGLKMPHSQPIYNDIPAIRQLVGDGVAYLTMRLEHDALAEFLGVVTQPSKVKVEDVKNYLRDLKANSTAQTAQIEICLKIYQFLAQQGDYGVLERERLVYVPTASCQWWSPAELFWNDYHELFGEQRGYLSTVYAENSQAIFEKIGVNVGEPTPQDWANLLCTQPNDTALIWCAYGELEKFLRAEPTAEALAWWADFAKKVKLLTVSGEFISPSQGIYLPDISAWYDEFRPYLPFLELGENAWKQYEGLLTKLGLRHLSDGVMLKPYPSSELYADIAHKLRQEIAENCSFMYSILAAKTNYDSQAKAQFEPNLAILLRDGDFQVKLVDSLEVEVSIPSHPEIKPIQQKRHAFYHASEKTLYVFILVNDKKSIPREVGIAVATIFEEFEEKVNSYFAHLFVTPSKPTAKKKLLKDFKIPFMTWPDPPPPPPPPPAWPEYQPDEVESKMMNLEEWQLKESPTEYHAESPQTELDEAMKKKVGHWGEAYAVECLIQKFCNGYHTAITTIEWLNGTGESGEPFDIKTTQADSTTYWEVKATPGNYQEWFMSMQEWIVAVEHGDNYHILRVFNAGTDKAYLVDLPNPVKLWRENKLTIAHPIRVGLT